jgi:hypothetical protein
MPRGKAGRQSLSPFRALRFHEPPEAWFHPMRGRITVSRKTRDGRARRYVMSRGLLNQVLADGERVTAAHLRTIIRLDDDV